MSSRRGPADRRDPATLFAALGDPTRLALLTRLAEGGPRSIAGLAEGEAITRQAVTKHLRVLAQAGFVDSARVGRESRYACRIEGVRAAESWLSGIERQWRDALGRLKAVR